MDFECSKSCPSLNSEDAWMRRIRAYASRLPRTARVTAIKTKLVVIECRYDT